MTTLSDESTKAPPDAPALEEVRAFIYREGRLLDEGRFDDWLTLWADDGCYWVPIGPDDSSPRDHVSIIHDDRQRIGQRVRRLNSEYAWAHVPQTLSARVISNIELRPELSDATKPEMVVSASMLVGEFREDRQELYCGRLEYRVRREPAGIRMVVKKVSLINRAGPLRNISAVL